MRAHAYGLVSIVGLEAAPRLPIVGLLSDTNCALTVMGDDGELGDKLKRLIARYIGLFFADIEPELGAPQAQVGRSPRPYAALTRNRPKDRMGNSGDRRRLGA